SDVEIVEVLVKPGDVVRAEQTLITLETDKAAMEVPSPAAGTVREMKVKQGGRVSTGDVIVVLDAEAETAPAEPGKPADTPAKAATPPPAKRAAPAKASAPKPAPGARAPATLPPID